MTMYSKILAALALTVTVGAQAQIPMQNMNVQAQGMYGQGAMYGQAQAGYGGAQMQQPMYGQQQLQSVTYPQPQLEQVTYPPGTPTQQPYVQQQGEQRADAGSMNYGCDGSLRNSNTSISASGQIIQRSGTVIGH